MILLQNGDSGLTYFAICAHAVGPVQETRKLQARYVLIIHKQYIADREVKLI